MTRRNIGIGVLAGIFGLGATATASRATLATLDNTGDVLLSMNVNS